MHGLEKITTLFYVLLPLFVGFLLPLRQILGPIYYQKFMASIDQTLKWLVFAILAMMGFALSQMPNLGQEITNILGHCITLLCLVLGMNLLVFMLYDAFFAKNLIQAIQQGKQAQQLKNYQLNTHNQHPKDTSNKSTSLYTDLAVSFWQLIAVIVGFLFGYWIYPTISNYTGISIDNHSIDSIITYALMLLIFIVGLQLKGSGFSLQKVLLNKAGLVVSCLFVFSCLSAGAVFAYFNTDVALSQGLAMASGFGWYSLSGIVMTEAYGAVWGSVALLHDLAREFFALASISLLMRCFPHTAISIGGATSLDFTLPAIQQSGGLVVIPIAISFGFIVNILSPLLMVVFSTLSF